MHPTRYRPHISNQIQHALIAKGRRVKHAAQEFDRWLWPPKCQECDASSDTWVFPDLCQACWVHTYHPARPARIDKKTILLSAQYYVSFWRTHLIRAKFKQNLHSYEILEHAVAHSLSPLKSIPLDGVVMIPAHPVRSFFRGGHLLSHFALLMSESLNIPMIKHGLRRIRSASRQSKISCKKKRRANIKGVFVASNRVSQKNILLIDDVATTGATLKEAIKTLERQQPNAITCYTILRSKLEV